MNRDLVLVPTVAERRIVEPRLGGARPRLELCGFGMAAAAARAAELVATLRPARVLLVGIAGRLDDRLPLGSAWWFDRVACHGIGAGTGEAFVAAAAMGWPQWPGDGDDAGAAVGDLLACGWPGPTTAGAGLLLSACAASATAADVRIRRAAFPDAAAEEMEGFAVALACRLQRVPCGIVRGISNAAGDRERANWRIAAALEAAADLAARLLDAGP